MGKKPKGKEKIVRKVIYPELKVKLYQTAKGTGLTYEEAQKYLGWHEEVGEVKFKTDFLFMDRYEKKIRCNYNSINRPFQIGLAETWRQEIANGRWRLNGETMIFGKTGEIIAAQHRLVGFCLAVQDYRLHPENFPAWEEEPTMDCIVVMGIEETDDVVNTVDTGRPRSLADVIYRSPHFKDLKESARKACARDCDFAIRNLWDRTQVSSQPLAPRRTISESIEFLDAHPSLLKSVRHIHDEDKVSVEGGTISNYVQRGVAAALHYLMATSATDTDDYRKAEPRNEKICVLTRWNKANEFWRLMGAKDKSTNCVRIALSNLGVNDGDLTGGTRLEKICILIKAWNLWLEGRSRITSEDVAPEYKSVGDEGQKAQINHPVIGGIDLGTRTSEIPDDIPGQEDIEEAKAEAQAKKEAKTKGKKEPVTIVNREADRRIDKTHVAGKPTRDGIDKTTGFKARLSKEQLHEQREKEAKALDAKEGKDKKPSAKIPETPTNKPKGSVPKK